MVRLVFLAFIFGAGFYAGMKLERGRVEQNCSAAGGMLTVQGYCDLSEGV
ncbi:hypothetical protein [Chachezhania sediminis]|nr:hypothetical protein [Chachezhania sediminis]